MTVLFLDKPGVSVHARREQVVVSVRDEPSIMLPITQIERVVVVGMGVQISTPALLLFAARGVDVAFLRRSGMLAGRFAAPGRRDVAIRVAQVTYLQDPNRRLALARSCVKGKLINQAILLERRGAGESARRIREAAARAETAPDLDVLRGHEGAGAQAYFAAWRAMLPDELRFRGRAYHPPTDAVNAALSLLYTCLMQDAMKACVAAGMDVDLGVFHESGPAKPSLALDLMEEFRPLTVDSIVLQAAHNGWIALDARETGVRLARRTRRLLLEGYERRMATRRRAVSGDRRTYRGCVGEQARRIAAVVLGNETGYTALGWA